MRDEAQDGLLTVQDVSRRLNVPTSWVYARAEANELPHLKIGRYLRFEPKEIESYIEQQRQRLSKQSTQRILGGDRS